MSYTSQKNCKIYPRDCFTFGKIGLVLIIVLLSACADKTEPEQSLLYSRELNIIENTVTYSFTGAVKRGEAFEEVLPNGLVFNLVPTEYAELGWMGWNIHIGPASESSQNYAGIVTPPFRGINALQILGWHFRNADNTGPNDGSTNAPQETRRFQLVLNEEDYQTASEALECIMWPPLCEEMDEKEAFDLHMSVPITTGVLSVTQLELGNLEPEQQAWIEEMAFTVELDLPTEQ